MDDVEVEDGGVLVLEEDVLVEVDELVLVLEVQVEDVEKVLRLEIEGLDGELVLLFDVFVNEDSDKLDVDVDVVVEVLFVEEVRVLVQLEELLVELLLALDEVLVDIVDIAENRQCQDRFELRAVPLELCHCASLVPNSCESILYKNETFEKQCKCSVL